MRRPIEDVMQEINIKLTSKGLSTPPENRLRVLAERHLDDVEFGTFVQWKKLRKGKEANGNNKKEDVNGV